jgi:hypothetical protein
MIALGILGYDRGEFLPLPILDDIQPFTEIPYQFDKETEHEIAAQDNDSQKNSSNAADLPEFNAGCRYGHWIHIKSIQ